MAAAPLTLAAPAVAGALAYVNAKASLWHDLLIAKGMFHGFLTTTYRQRAQRLNLFSDLGYWATRPDHADLPILLQPQGRTWTYAQLYDAALRYGYWLKAELGVKPKQVVAMYYTTSDMFIVTWMALWSIGATPAFINHFLTGKGLAHCLNVSGAAVCLVEPALAAQVQEVEADISPMRVAVVTPEVQKLAFSSPAVRYSDEIRKFESKSDVALLIYTSGTTGFPKAAVMSWARVIWFCAMTGNCLGLGKGHTIFSAMPFYHGMASLIGFASTLLAGGTLAFTPKFSKATFWRDVRETNADTIIYVGEALRYLLDAPTEHDPVTGENLDKKHRVKTVYGAGLRADVWPKFKERFGIDTIIEFYAATEGVAGTWNISRNALSEAAVARVGWLFRTLFFNRKSAIVLVDPDTDDPLRDKNGFCIKAKPGETGELLFKLPAGDVASVFQGYYKNPAATEGKILRDVLVPGDAWFRSGDALRWAPGGELLFFRDRLGDTFRWKGENVSTVEVGDAVCMHPCVAEANVYGVALPHHDGRAGCAATSFRSGEAPTEEELRSLAEHLRKGLPRYAVPLFLRLVKEGGHEVTTTGTHKQQKVALRRAGVNPVGEGGEDVKLYWLKGDTYVPFGKEEWQRMQTGKVKL
ncbi:AMP-dependent synthetase/ligase [Cordyceps fumosorosea ARSEF 2679]|uniref:Very long-chain fatty acid transport protein n=1 Tax=Cordyceps fumosorosea (strain ARSEF 2679) TaxID=1081104 RepID=A0A167N5E8_CORFA|nr:AMP-dependent synthetase/ligase [Cordyceps fumosorosea ARSEF 2679]OAA55148.1 AMP-dependent synthetase/ligase [Cordyceps fumosorosea ARSEF 2679]